MSEANRREFLKTGAAAVAGAAALGALRVEADAAEQAAYSGEFKAPPIELVRIGYVGVGLQGGSHVQNLIRIPGCRITAVCDIRAERTDWATKQITGAGHPAP